MFELQGLAEVVLKSMAEGVLVTDEDGKIVLANLAVERVFSVTEPEIKGKTIRLAIRNNEIADLAAEVIKTKKTVEREISIIFPVEADFLALASPVQREGGGVVCVLHDITQLRKLERFRSEFAANISHELKTPLTSIRNYVETLLAGALKDEKHNLEFLNKIEKHALNLSSLIEDILEISKLESRQQIGQFSRVDLAVVIDHAAETIAEKAKKKKIAIQKTCEKDAFLIQGLGDHIYRAILNLLDNAINYTNEGGRVEISCYRNDGQIIVNVKDSGIGITAEHLPRIFERFYRVDKARSRELGGTGLGLAIVKHVMNLHNGTVSAESKEGQGSTFTLTFPA
ncbi:PAS domain-containing protein [Candidatus Saganbacteria bacterium]|nr:PAS domain-containing protein [Candidatus Saganbacteria bacterium]